ncbi:hypothetical protein CHUAL_007191 [Chamberlinius hualienensis]
MNNYRDVGSSENMLEQQSMYLSDRPIRFEPVSKVTHVFYDESNEQVFAVRGSGATGVVVKGPNEQSGFSFRIEDKGPVISVKFSPNKEILAIQRSKSSVDFLNIQNGEPDNLEYSQICKGKSSSIIGYVWTDLTEIGFVTDHGVEIYQVLSEKRSLKLTKTLAFNINWFVYQSSSRILLLSLGSQANQMQAFQFKKSYEPIKYPKFEVELPPYRSSSQHCLPERDVILVNIYGHNYVAVLRHPPPRSKGSMSSEVILYSLQRSQPTRKTAILKLDVSGRFAINVVDNLVVVHNQISKTSAIFDIALNGESDGYVTYHDSVISSLSIKPYKINVPVVAPLGPQTSAEIVCEMYSQNWVVFQPNIIIDAKIGCLWHLEFNFANIVLLLTDKCKLIEFLLHRDPSWKSVLVNVNRDLLLQPEKPSLQVISTIFDKLNNVYRYFLNNESRNSSDVVASRFSGSEFLSSEKYFQYRLFVDQSDMYTHVFTVVAEKHENDSHKFLVTVIMEYIRSLYQLQITVQHYLYELVINTLVHHRCFYQLHQLLQYNVLSNSKPLACLMLSLEGAYAPAHQLGLDMLKKLCTADEEIIEVLLSKQLIIPALRLINCEIFDKMYLIFYYERFESIRMGVCNLNVFTFIKPLL